MAHLWHILHPLRQVEHTIRQRARRQRETQCLPEHAHRRSCPDIRVPSTRAPGTLRDYANGKEDDGRGAAGTCDKIEEERREEIDAADDSVVSALMRDVGVRAMLREDEGAERAGVVAEAVAALAGGVDGADAVEGEAVMVEVCDGC